MRRREFLRSSAAMAAMVAAQCTGLVPLKAAFAAAPRLQPRVRPGQPGWPSADAWRALSRRVGGRLHVVADPVEVCRREPQSAATARRLRDLQNPFYIQEQMGGTESSGWIDGWKSVPSARAVAVECAADVAAAVDFARTHNLRLVVKGGAHSYLGQSNAPDSLLVWMQRFHQIDMHDAFVPQGAPVGTAPIPAVSVQAGAVWLQVYEQVIVKGRRYVQGGGCTSVGVGGHLQTGGFGSFSKRFGMSAAGIVELELVTSDGAIRVVNRYRDPDLFWAWKGAGAAFGIATRVTLRTLPLPETFGSARGVIAARSESHLEGLVRAFLTLYRDGLMNPHWGEQATIDGHNRLSLNLSCQGLTTEQALACLKPLVDYVAAHADGLSWESPLRVDTMPAHTLWAYDRLSKATPSRIHRDTRPSAPRGRYWFKGDQDQVSVFWAGYESGWLHRRLLEASRLPSLARALVSASRHHWVGLHFNKGLAGAPPEMADEVRNGMCVNPVAADAFALVIIADGQQYCWSGVPGHEPDETTLHAKGRDVKAAMDVLRAIAPDAGGYASEMSYHAADWREAAWGPHYPRLLEIKKRVDPVGLFVGHHYVGSELWSEDGFTPAR